MSPTERPCATEKSDAESCRTSFSPTSTPFFGAVCRIVLRCPCSCHRTRPRCLRVVHHGDCSEGGRLPASTRTKMRSPWAAGASCARRSSVGPIGPRVVVDGGEQAAHWPSASPPAIPRIASAQERTRGGSEVRPMLGGSSGSFLYTPKTETVCPAGLETGLRIRYPSARSGCKRPSRRPAQGCIRNPLAESLTPTFVSE